MDHYIFLMSTFFTSDDSVYPCFATFYADKPNSAWVTVGVCVWLRKSQKSPVVPVDTNHRDIQTVKL